MKAEVTDCSNRQGSEYRCKQSVSPFRMRLRDLHSRILLLVIALLMWMTVGYLSQGTAQETSESWQEQRDQMVQHVLVGSGIKNQRVLEAMRKTPRHLFVPRHLRESAYLDMALPIGQQQTISSPFIVAYMTECLDPQATEVVLEIGTGSGYQAAVLSPLVRDVCTIEIVPALGKQAQKLLHQLELRNVHVKIGDGFQGWPERAPFDKIIVTCSPEKVPQPLIDQLKEGGRMVIPVGERYQQTMYLFRKVEGKLERESLRPTLFVPMTGEAEASREVQPDPAHPQLVNGNFELPGDAEGNVPGWYYQRQATLTNDTDAPEGKQYVRFESKQQGLESHLMQGLAVDGRQVHQLRVSCWVRTAIPEAPVDLHAGPRLAITFYDHDRRELATRWLGPWIKSTPWREASDTLRVPGGTKEIIVRLGLFGGWGTADFDKIEIEAVTAKP